MTRPQPPLPKEPRHQRFADLVLSGKSAADAYRCAGFKAKSPGAVSNCASRLMKRKDVRAYMTAIRARAADETTLTLLERRRFYARIVRTPLWKIDPQDPMHADGDLIRKYKETETGWEIEKLDPLKACELDTKAAGEDSADNSLEALARALSSLGAPAPVA